MAEAMKRMVVAQTKTATKKAVPTRARKAGSTAKAAGPKLMKPAVVSPVVVTHEEIEKLAHRFWAERGYQHGSAEIDWFRAEQELRGRAS
jgi:Protein of unknown function (DUF2934)